MSPRGPSGAAAAPPPWLRDRPLPVEEVAPGTALHRVHRLDRSPLFFGPGPGVPPTGRFDPASGRFGVLYAGLDRDAALVETLLRNPARLMVPWRDVEARAISELRAPRPLRLVAAHGAGLSWLGLDAALGTGPYDPCGLWADALWDHPDAPDGILWASRHDPSRRCAALFDRPLPLAAGAPVPLVARLHDVGRLLDAHGKSLGLDP